MKKILVIAILSLISITANSAERRMTLNEFIDQEIQLNQEALDQTANNDGHVVDEWNMSRVRLRIRAKGGIDVPKLLKFEVQPYVEFYWNKK